MEVVLSYDRTLDNEDLNVIMVEIALFDLTYNFVLWMDLEGLTSAHLLVDWIGWHLAPSLMGSEDPGLGHEYERRRLILIGSPVCVSRKGNHKGRH